MDEGSAARGFVLILPVLPHPHQGAIQLDNNYWVRGEYLDMRPRVLDTDIIDIPGVGAHILYSSILLHEEGQYFHNCLEDMDEFECHLAIVSYLVSFLISLFSLVF